MERIYLRKVFGIKNSSEALEIVISPPVQSADGAFESSVKFNIEEKFYKEVNIPGISEFDCIVSSLQYCGNSIRGMKKNEGIEIDMGDMSIDDYFPLPKTMREIWDE